MCCSGIGKFFEKPPESEISRTILPEELVFGYGQGEKYKNLMLKEARELWSSTDGWRLDVKGNPSKGVPRIESCPVKGPYAESGIRIWKAYAEIPSSFTCTTQLLASPEGQAILDPSATQQTLFDPVEIMEGHEDEYIKVEHVVEQIPKAKKKNVFVVLNAASARTYSLNYVLSKSILHPTLPGYSKYFNPVDEDGRSMLPEFFKEAMQQSNFDELYTRGLQTFAIKIEKVVEDDTDKWPGSEKPRCAVTFVRWKDYSLPESCLHSNFDITNRMNKNFFKPFYQRLIRKVAEIDKAKLSPPGELGESFHGKL